MPDREKVIKELESLLDICNAKSNMAIGKGKIAWAGYANAVNDALALLKEQPNIVRCKDCFYADDFDCSDPLPAGYLCQKGHGSHMGDWFCADGERPGLKHTRERTSNGD